MLNDNFSLNKSITNWGSVNTFGTLQGFSILESANSTYYYVCDYQKSKIYMFDDNWTYISYRNYSAPAYIAIVGSNLYITGDADIYKTNGNLDLLDHVYVSTWPWYRGIYYNSTNNLLYTAPCKPNINAIHVYDLDLNLNDSIAIPSYTLFSIAGYNDQLYVGTYSSVVLVIENKAIIQTLHINNGNMYKLTSIFFDSNGYMAITSSENQIYLVYPNGTYVSLQTPNEPFSFGYDTKGNFVLLSTHQINLYNLNKPISAIKSK